MSEYGEGHPGVFGVTDLPAYQGDHDKGRTFYWGEDSGNIRRLIAARAAHRGPVRLEPALRPLQPLWDAITGPAPAGDDGEDLDVPAAYEEAPPARYEAPDLQMSLQLRRQPSPAPPRHHRQDPRGHGRTRRLRRDVLASLPPVTPKQWAEARAERQAEALAANDGAVAVPDAALAVLMRLLASADGTTASAAAEAMATETGSGSKSVAHRYLTALRVAGIARLDGSGRGAKFRRADSLRLAAVGPGLTVAPPTTAAPPAARPRARGRRASRPP